MKILVDVYEALFRRMRKMVDNGKYSSLSDFILMAAENQLLLEETGSKNTVIDNSIIATNKTNTSLEMSLKKLSKPSESSIATVDLPSLKQLQFPTVESPHDMYIWGQINRILPMKVALRALCNYLLHKHEKYMKLDYFSEQVSNVAVLLKKILAEKTGKEKGSRNSLGAGLPDDTEKSISRYKFHFLIYLRKDGLIDGGLGRLKFANIKKNDENKVGITQQGWEFCCLRNPVLDEDSYELGSLSDEEKHFYLSHIAQYIPYEEQAFNEILSLIQKGNNNPTRLNKQLRKIWPKKWSDAVINTQRSGLISRLAELSMIRRLKDGIKVTYEVTTSGKDFSNKKERRINE